MATLSQVKLDYFSATIEDTLAAEAYKKRQATQKANDTHIKDSLATAKRRNKIALQAKQAEITRRANRQISEAKVQAIRKYVTIERQQKDELLVLARAQLASYTLGPDYKKYMLKRIARVNNSHFAIIKLTPQDMLIADEIRAATGLVPEACGQEIIGGFILQDAQRTFQADHSFKTWLEEAVRDFRFS